MNKLFSTFLASLYLTLSLGLSVNVHYCHGKVSSVQIFKEIHKNCCSKDLIKKSSCCDDQLVVLEIDDVDQELVIPILKHIPHVISNKTFLKILKPKSYIPIDKKLARAPPKQPLYLLHSSFTFYG